MKTSSRELFRSSEFTSIFQPCSENREGHEKMKDEGPRENKELLTIEQDVPKIERNKWAIRNLMRRFLILLELRMKMTCFSAGCGVGRMRRCRKMGLDVIDRKDVRVWSRTRKSCVSLYIQFNGRGGRSRRRGGKVMRRSRRGRWWCCYRWGCSNRFLNTNFIFQREWKENNSFFEVNKTLKNKCNIFWRVRALDQLNGRNWRAR